MGYLHTVDYLGPKSNDFSVQTVRAMFVYVPSSLGNCLGCAGLCSEILLVTTHVVELTAGRLRVHYSMDAN